MQDRQRQYMEKIKSRSDELNQLLSSPDIVNNVDLLRNYSKEASNIREIATLFDGYLKIEEEIEETSVLLKDADHEVRDMASAEMNKLKEQLAQKLENIQESILGKESADNRNVYLEIRAGAGGDEAAIFGGDLLSMYQRYADKRGWKYDIVGLSQSDHGGYKQAVVHITGEEIYGELKFESGTHRVQRVPKTEAKGRLHTSTCTVAIIPEASPTDDIEIKKSDLRIDTFRASGAGGQHVNKTDSAIRITHLPTGIVCECQEDRSQHRNKEKALSILKSKILQEEIRKKQEETTQLRKSLVGSGDRAEKIRTYNYPQNRVTDHRLGLTLHSLDHIILGELDGLIGALQTEEKNIIASGGEAI